MLRGKKYFIGVCATLVLLAPVFVFCQRAEKDYGLTATAEGTALSQLPISNQTPEQFAASIVQNILIFVGTIFFLLILYAGVSWMLAQGSSEKINTAKNILITAIIGLIIVAASYAISTFIFNKLAPAVAPEDTEAVWCQSYPSGVPECTPISNTAEAINLCTSKDGGTVVYEDCTPTTE